jgi:hypothetical protein
LQATEDKYKSVRAINQKLEEQLLASYFQVEVLEARCADKPSVLSTVPRPTPSSSSSSSVRNPPVQQGPSSPFAETLKPLPTVTTATEMTDLHSIVDRELPPATMTHSPSSPPPRARTGNLIIIQFSSQEKSKNFKKASILLFFCRLCYKLAIKKNKKKLIVEIIICAKLNAAKKLVN